MAVDIPDYTQAVNVTGGSVSITGTATVQITGTPTVSISGTPTVNVGNTPSVTISSGTVTATISGTPNINVQSQSVTINVNQPQSALADLSFPNTGATTQTTAAVPAGTHALQLTVIGAAGMTVASIKGHQTGAQYAPLDVFGASDTLFNGNATFVIPVNSIQDTTYDVRATNNSAGAITVKVSAILDTQATWVQNRLDLPVYTLNAGYVNALGGKKRTLPPPPVYGSLVSSAPATGSQASATSASPTSPFAWEAVLVSWSIAQTAANAAAVDVTLQDGVTTIWDDVAFGPAGAGNGSNNAIEEGGFGARPGNTMTLNFTSAVGSNLERVNLGVILTA